MYLRSLSIGIVFACLQAVELTAGPLSGTFNIDGSVTVTQISQHWTSNASIDNQATIASTALTGNFVGLQNTNITIQDLIRSTEPVGVVVPGQPFISFLAAPSLGTLNIELLFGGVFPSTQCLDAASPGQVCTPPITDGSPFSFVNTAGGGTTASWSMFGVTADHQSTWNGVFTSQFTVPYQTVLSNFNTNGFITNSFSAAFVVTPTPEPNTPVLMGAGLLLLVLGLRRISKRA